MNARSCRTSDIDQCRTERGLLRFITAGSVDDGKSTLIGRLLFDSKGIFADQLDAISRAKHKRTVGDTVDLSLLTDGLEAEREQGITIDVAYRYFATPKRKFIIADTPGHEQYTRNMVTGASTADAVIILIDVSKVKLGDDGSVELLTQTKRHSTIAHLLRRAHSSQRPSRPRDEPGKLRAVGKVEHGLGWRPRRGSGRRLRRQPARLQDGSHHARGHHHRDHLAAGPTPRTLENIDRRTPGPATWPSSASCPLADRDPLPRPSGRPRHAPQAGERSRPATKTAGPTPHGIASGGRWVGAPAPPTSRSRSPARRSASRSRPTTHAATDTRTVRPPAPAVGPAPGRVEPRSGTASPTAADPPPRPGPRRAASILPLAHTTPAGASSPEGPPAPRPAAPRHARPWAPSPPSPAPTPRNRPPATAPPRREGRLRLPPSRSGSDPVAPAAAGGPPGPSSACRPDRSGSGGPSRESWVSTVDRGARRRRPARASDHEDSRSRSRRSAVVALEAARRPGTGQPPGCPPPSRRPPWGRSISARGPR